MLNNQGRDRCITYYTPFCACTNNASVTIEVPYDARIVIVTRLWHLPHEALYFSASGEPLLFCLAERPRILRLLDSAVCLFSLQPWRGQLQRAECDSLILITYVLSWMIHKFFLSILRKYIIQYNCSYFSYNELSLCVIPMMYVKQQPIKPSISVEWTSKNETCAKYVMLIKQGCACTWHTKFHIIKIT